MGTYRRQDRCRVILSKSIADVAIDTGMPTLCVRHKAYDTPEIAGDVEHVLYSDFKRDARRWLGDKALVFVGLTRCMTPGTRTQEVWEVLCNLTRDHPKWSIDTALFLREPWRAWFHFGVTNQPYGQYTYSYLAESHWKAYQDGTREIDPFGADEIVRWGRGAVCPEYGRFFDQVSVTVHPMSADVHAEYADLKAECFDQEHTIGAIVRRLGKFAQRVCPERSIPDPTRVFHRTRHQIARTDLKIDVYLADRLLELASLTDEVAGALHGVHDGC